jgi:protein-tyrosine-phosphatase
MESVVKQPVGRVNPGALELLQRRGYPTEGLRSKSWDEYAAPGATQMDFIFTVCDDAAGETCPYWPGQPVSAHWGVPDPSRTTGTDAEIAAAFAETHRMLHQRISIFVNLPLAALDQRSLKRQLDDIGRLPQQGNAPETAA